MPPLPRLLPFPIRGCVASPAGIAVAWCVPRALHNRTFKTGTPPIREKFNKGWLYEFRQIFSKEAKKERERKLEEEVNRGQFWELRELDATGGKLFEADVGLLAAEQSKQFPNVEGFLLNGEKTTTSDMLGGNVSLVTVCIRDMGRPMVDSWAKAFQKEIGKSEATQIVQLSFVEGATYKLFKGTLLGALKSRTEQDLHAGQIMAFESSEPFREAVGIKNRVVGYAFLVDPERRIRWRAVGYALKYEVELLVEGVQGLATGGSRKPAPHRGGSAGGARGEKKKRGRS